MIFDYIYINMNRSKHTITDIGNREWKEFKDISYIFKFDVRWG